MFWIVSFGIFLLVSRTNGVYHCTEPSLLLATTQGEKLEGFPIETLLSSTLMACGKECFYQTNCVSFNFNIEIGQCELNRNKTSVTAPLISSPGFLYAEKSSWTNIISNPCRNMTCLINEKCIVQDLGYGIVAACVLYDCNVPPDMTYSNSVVYSGTVIGYDVSYTCGGPSVLKTTLTKTCNASGQWVGDGQQCKKIASCSDVQRCDGSLNDGEFWIYPPLFNNTQRIRIYCYGLDTTIPVSYVTLVHKNFVRSTNFKVIVNGTTCNTKSSNYDRLGGATFNKVKVNLAQMDILKGNLTFTTDLVGTQQYATVADCTSNEASCEHRQHGYIKIDTRDTGLMINKLTSWETFETEAFIRYLNRSSDHIIELECTGHCGGCTPKSPFRFELDPNATLDDSSANAPICI